MMCRRTILKNFYSLIFKLSGDLAPGQEAAMMTATNEMLILIWRDSAGGRPWQLPACNSLCITICWLLCRAKQAKSGRDGRLCTDLWDPHFHQRLAEINSGGIPNCGHCSLSSTFYPWIQTSWDLTSVRTGSGRGCGGQFIQV